MPFNRTGGPWKDLPTPLLSYGENSESSDGPESPSNPGSPCLERSTVVPSSTEYAMGVSSTGSSHTQSNAESSGAGSTGANPPASHVAYLWEKFSNSSFSEEASSLLPGGPSQASHMTRISGNGLAGVLNEVPIPFQDL